MDEGDARGVEALSHRPGVEVTQGLNGPVGGWLLAWLVAPQAAAGDSSTGVA